ncbi:ABC transporter ATP-binding protein [Candidatus Phytoplasma phoenicium]|uniref:Multidrug resistance ABC transporter ATP-binding and permease protein n=1 Tax=Candidatus Phytoplasma phoenicium TaxID=198422 RepID=A0A0L0MKU3_9MOLU|nr:ABC transporter ATP-binding protein [Candidatus Phytoplasma phoenicium]KND62604.1 multidrug resistance ABC transporter ATP-binding and permease protein [Candidatus Phytoplasma phoenicium]
MKNLTYYLKPFKSKLAISFVLIWIFSAISAFIPLFEGEYIIGYIHANPPKSQIYDTYMHYMLIFLSINLLLYVMCTLIKFIYNRLLITSIHSAIKEIRAEMQQKIHKLSIKYFDQNTVGNIMSRMTQDIEVLVNGLQQSCATLIASFFNIWMLSMLMFWVNWRLGMVVCLLIPMSLITIFIINRKSRSVFIERFEKSGECNGFLQEKYTGHKEILLYNQQCHMIEEFRNLNHDLTNTIFKSNFLSGLVVPIVNSFTYILLLIMLVLGISLTQSELNPLLSKLGFVTIQVGMFQAFIQYVWRLGNPINDLSQIFVILQSTKAASNRIFTFLSEMEEIEEVEELVLLTSTQLQGHVVFSNVSFGYYKNQWIIKDMNLVVQPQQTVAIVGSTGSGKTTLINLLARFYEIQKGTILIDGIDIKKISRHHLRSILGIVFQDIWLFQGTILENLRYGNHNKTYEQIIAAAQQTKIHDLIMAKKDRYQTVIGDELDNLSQGEKQLITITRTLLHDPSILILDEATSTIDIRMEKILQQSIQKLLQQKTAFVIAHRLSTIVNADLIVVLQNGVIVEQGKHQELLKQKGFYYNLYISQFQK